MAKKLEEIIENSIISDEENISKNSRKTSTKKGKKQSKKSSSNTVQLNEDTLIEEPITDPIIPVVEEKIETITLDSDNIATVETSKKKKRTLHLNINFGKEIKVEEKPKEVEKIPSTTVTTNTIKKVKKIDTSINQNSSFFYQPSVFEKFNLSVLDVNDDKNFNSNEILSANIETENSSENNELTAEKQIEEEKASASKNKIVKGNVSDVEATIDKELFEKIVEKTSSKKASPSNNGSYINQNAPFFYEPSVFEKFNLKISGIDEETNSVKLVSKVDNTPVDNTTILNEILEIINSNKDTEDFSNDIPIVRKGLAFEIPNGKTNFNNIGFNMNSIKEFVENKVDELLTDKVDNPINENNSKIYRIEDFVNNAESKVIEKNEEIGKTSDTLDSQINNDSQVADNIDVPNNTTASAEKKDLKNISLKKRIFDSPVFKKFSFEDTKVNTEFSKIDSDDTTFNAAPLNTINTIIKETSVDAQSPATNIDTAIPEISIMADNTSIPEATIASVDIAPVIPRNLVEDNIDFSNNIISNSIPETIENDIIDELLEKELESNDDLAEETNIEDTDVEEAVENTVEDVGTEEAVENIVGNTITEETDKDIVIEEEKTVEDLLTEILTLDKTNVDENLKNTLLSEISATEEKLVDSLPPIKDSSNIDDGANSDFTEAIDSLNTAINKLKLIDENNDSEDNENLSNE